MKYRHLAVFFGAAKNWSGTRSDFPGEIISLPVTPGKFFALGFCKYFIYKNITSPFYCKFLPAGISRQGKINSISMLVMHRIQMRNFLSGAVVGLLRQGPDSFPYGFTFHRSGL